jgi:hypothetical protein
MLQGKGNCHLLFILRGIAGALPCLEPSLEDGHVFEANVSQLLCRTGT